MGQESVDRFVVRYVRESFSQKTSAPAPPDLQYEFCKRICSQTKFLLDLNPTVSLSSVQPLNRLSAPWLFASLRHLGVPRSAGSIPWALLLQLACGSNFGSC